jgi:hypothetical protein
VQRGRLSPEEWLKAKKTADVLVGRTQQRLDQIAGELTAQIAAPSRAYRFGTNSIPGPDHVVAITRALPTHDFAAYDKLVNLVLKTATVSNLSISFQPAGPQYGGIIGVVAYLSSQGLEPVLFPGGTFQINYEEAPKDAEERFAVWLERMIVAGLTEWRRTL